MFITKVTKYRKDPETKVIKDYPYYRLSMSYREGGVKKSRVVIGLGPLEGFTKSQRDELADMLTVMIEKGETVMSDTPALYEKALEYYSIYRQSKYARENDPKLIAEAKRKERERLCNLVTINLDTLTQKEARTVGMENLCNSTLRILNIREFLAAKGWTREQTDIALMQIIARAIYPYSELKTVRYLRENTALTEIFKVSKEKMTKDVLYKSAQHLWDVHKDMEDWLHSRVCSMFGIEEKVLLFDITNTYFEGRYNESDICQFGRSKEKRSDCKITVLAAVVNAEGLLVRTMIYEGNRQDSTTLKEVIGSIAKETPTATGAKKVVVMDAGFYTKPNVDWLIENGYDYITVLPSGDSKFTATSDKIVDHTDSKGQQIRLQMGKVTIDGLDTKALLVDSDMKAAKEKSMWEQSCKRYEDGLKAIKHGIETKGGTKKRDAVNNRIGKLNQKYGAIRKNFTTCLNYEKKGKDEIVTSFEWQLNTEKSEEIRKFHGKYVLITSLDESKELNIWKFYNVIRTVEETFHVLKTDLDIRPVYHKSDDGIKAHLNLAVLAYWLVSVTKYRLKIKHYPNVRWDEIKRIASTQVVVTASMETKDGDMISIRQSTEAEEKLSAIYSLLDINSHPLGKRKSVVHLKLPQKKSLPNNQTDT